MTDLPTLSVQESLYPETVVGLKRDERDGTTFRRFTTASLIIVAVMIAVHTVEAGGFGAVGALNLFCFCGFVLSLSLHSSVGRTSAGLTYIGVGLIGILGVALLQGGISAPSLVFAVFPGWLASFFLQPRWATIVSGITIVAITAMFVVGVPAPDVVRSVGATDLARYVTLSCAIVLSAVLGVAQVRARIVAEQSLTQATERARAMLDALPDTFVLLETSGKILEVRVPSDSALKPLSRLVNHRLHSMLAEPEAARLQGALSAVVANGQPQTVEISMLFAGKVLDIEARVSTHPEGNLVALLRDISEQKRSRRMKDQFVATVSHELRTPLTSIHGSLALLKNQALGEMSADAADVAELAWRNSDRLRRLIDDLLDVQKMESGHLDLRMGLFSVHELLSQSVEANRAYATQYGVSLTYDGRAFDGVVHVDDDRFHQVVSNLLSNAIKYSLQGGTVVVEAIVAGQSVRIWVRDRGHGIPMSFRPHVFETFTQADSSETRQVGGTGLGLSICKRLVTAFGGTMGFESEEGVGTDFWFEVPIQDASATANRAT